MILFIPPKLYYSHLLFVFLYVCVAYFFVGSTFNLFLIIIIIVISSLFSRLATPNPSVSSYIKLPSSLRPVLFVTRKDTLYGRMEFMCVKIVTNITLMLMLRTCWLESTYRSCYNNRNKRWFTPESAMKLNSRTTIVDRIQPILLRKLKFRQRVIYFKPVSGDCEENI